MKKKDIDRASVIVGQKNYLILPDDVPNRKPLRISRAVAQFLIGIGLPYGS